MKRKRILSLMITMAVVMTMVTCVFPITASAVTSNIVDGFYAVSNAGDVRGVRIDSVKVSGSWATLKISLSTSGSFYSKSFTWYSFSCMAAENGGSHELYGKLYIYHIPGHISNDFTSDNEKTHSGTCKFCGEFTQEHIYDNNCDTTCNFCDYERSIEHDWHEATCGLPQFCQCCGITGSNAALEHKYENGYCTACGKEENGEVLHIKTAKQLDWFAYTINNGNPQTSAILENDINMSAYPNRKIGTSEKPYAGTFDGNGHKITFSLSGDTYTALFPYVNGATIKNLTVDGSITTSDKFAAGIVGYSSGNTTLENCMSLVTINSSVSGDGTHGGLVANASDGSLVINNCAFVGAINGENTQNCGGLVGWAGVETKISNSYVAANFAINTDGSSNTIARNPGKVKISNCYYTNALGTASAENVSEEQVKNGELAYKLNGSVGGGDKWYQNIDKGTKDNYPVPNSSHGLVYYGYADCNAEIAKFTNTYTKKSVQGHNGDTATCLKAGYCADCGIKYLEIDSTAHETDDTYCRIIDDTEHGTYHSCCNALIKRENHTSSTEVATCKNVAKCDVCKSSYGSKDAENHTEELKWVDNGYGEHEYKYTCCGLVTETEAHSLEYSADDDTDTIGVKCTVCADNSADNWSIGQGTVTLHVSGKVYDGKSVAASYKATGFMNNWNKPVDISFDYCCTGGCKTAGTHTVTMHVGDKEVTKKFTITPKKLTVTKVRAFSKSYDMTNEVFVNAIDLDGIVIYQKGDYSSLDIKDNVAIDLSKAVITTESGDTDYYTEANVSNITLIGSDKDNYSIESSAEGVTLSNTYGGDYEIYRIQIWITPNDQTLYGDDAVLDQTAYTVDGLDDIYTLSGEFLYEDTNLGKIRVNAENIKITYGDEDVKQYFDITDYYTGNVVHYCANHTFNDDGFCATSECNSYEQAILITKENCEDFGFKESEISEYEPKYAIYNGGQLYWFADRVNNYNETAIVGVLADDIKVNEDLTAENLRVWTPIGTVSTPYSGSFYGNGHTVSGLYCKNTNTNGYVGFFGNLGYYPVSDLHIANSYFEG